MSRFEGQIAMFTVADRHYGVPVLLVEEFFRPLPVTPVPGSDPRVAGIINLRGVSATVVDLRRVLGLPQRTAGCPSRMVMLETDDRLSPEAKEAGLSAFPEPVALQVDRVEQVVTVRDRPFHPPPAHTGHTFATGVYELSDGYLTLLSVQAILASILASNASTSPSGSPTP
jgi:purine-binding chemotaxis protein CheW